jgi:hypothetical protein
MPTYQHVESGRTHVAPEPGDDTDVEVAAIWRRNRAKLDRSPDWQLVDDEPVEPTEPVVDPAAIVTGTLCGPAEPAELDSCVSNENSSSADDADTSDAEPVEPTDAEIRVWALANDVEVSPRGRVGIATIDAFKAAHAS